MQVYQTGTGNRQVSLSWQDHKLSSVSHIWLNQKCQPLEALLPRTWNHHGCLGNTGKWVGIHLLHPADLGQESNLFTNTSNVMCKYVPFYAALTPAVSADTEDKKTLCIQNRMVAWDNLIQCFLMTMISKYRGIFQRRNEKQYPPLLELRSRTGWTAINGWRPQVRKKKG